MNLKSIREAFQAHRETGAASHRAVMGRRAHYTRSIPPLTSTAIATLRTSCGRVVTMDREARDHLLGLYPDGLPAAFVAGNGKGNIYVRCSPPPSSGMARGNTVTLARLILGDEAKGSVVRYRDGNPFNLCRDNLAVIGVGGAA